MTNEKKPVKKKRFSELEERYKQDQREARAKIKAEPNWAVRFWKWVWYFISFSFKWLWLNIKDWRTALIFGIVVLVVSIEVWLPYLIGLITWGSTLSKVMMSVGSSCWLFWLAPGTPFIIICIGITMGIKELFNKIEEKKNGRKSNKARRD